MVYYHGSGIRFERFDGTFAGTGKGNETGCPIIHLTPHLDYARDVALDLKARTGHAYVYTVRVPGDEALVYQPYMFNICIRPETLEIISCNEIYE